MSLRYFHLIVYTLTLHLSSARLKSTETFFKPLVYAPCSRKEIGPSVRHPSLSSRLLPPSRIENETGRLSKDKLGGIVVARD
jgi:hypothetical protein